MYVFSCSLTELCILFSKKLKLHGTVYFTLSYQVRYMCEKRVCLGAEPNSGTTEKRVSLGSFFERSLQCLECHPSELSPLIWKQTSKVVWANYPIYIIFAIVSILLWLISDEVLIFQMDDFRICLLFLPQVIFPNRNLDISPWDK